MNLGLGNLASVKAYVLPGALSEETEFDARLATIAKGVTAALEKFCNRKLARAADDTFEFTGERAYVALPRFPIEEITALDQRFSIATGWETQGLDLILNRDDSAGLLDFGAPLGSYQSHVRVTYTGGFFIETLEPSEEGYPSEAPEGATALPPDLLQAWLLQCQIIFERTRSLSTSGVKEKAQAELGAMQLAEGVKEMVRPFIRF